MELSLENKYKDCLPNKTVNRIKAILENKVNIKLTEITKSNISGCFSAKVSISDTPFGTAGKGTTKEFALASAYGEFMERLQNQILFSTKYDLDGYHEFTFGFYHAPDEKELSGGDLRQKNEAIHEYFLSKGFQFQDDIKVLTIPFYNITQRKIEFIPQNGIDFLYGTNGMCAGNTREEALIQGISEIIERNLMFRVLKNKLKIPLLNNQFIKTSRLIQSLTADLQNENRFHIIFKDASSVFEIPAICAILTDRLNNSYFVRWGVHPIKDIAIERSITELFQYENINSISQSMTHFQFGSKKHHDYRNQLEAFKTGVASYPVSIFKNDRIKGILQDIKEESYSNEIILRDMIKKLHKRGLQMFIRDVSFLGFPSYRILMPNFSEVIDPMKIMDSDVGIKRFKQRLLSVKEYRDRDLSELASLVYQLKIPYHTPLSSLLKIPLTKQSFFSNINAGILLVMLHYSLKDYNRCFHILNKLLLNHPGPSERSFYGCMRDIIGATRIGLSKDNCVDLLGNFYQANLIERGYRILLDKDYFFKCLFSLNCFDCARCEEIDDCRFDTVRMVSDSVKKQYVKSKISQNSLEKAF